VRATDTSCDEQLAAQKGIAYRVGPGITAPRGIHTPDAKYPRTAVKTKKQGVVVLCVIVNPEGKVDDVRVSRRLSPDLDDSAVHAVSSWSFAPATKDGKPVAAQIYTEHFFKIKW
jgi:protein TonB